MSGGCYDTIILEETHFREIQEILEGKLSDENKLALQQACNGYLIDRETPLSKRSTTKKQLQAIQKYSECLLGAFHQADDFTAWCMSTSHPETLAGISVFPKLKPKEREIRGTVNTGLVKKMHDLLERLPSDLQVIEKAAAKAIKDLKPDKGGRPPEAALNGLVPKLQSIYEEITGRKATIIWYEIDGYSGGPFLDFIWSFLTVINCNSDVYSQEALAAIIKRSLQRSKPLPLFP